VVSLPEANWQAFEALAEDFGVPMTKLGYTGGDRFNIDGYCDVSVAQIGDVWNRALEVAGG